jgi:hypothetical protein
MKKLFFILLNLTLILFSSYDQDNKGMKIYKNEKANFYFSYMPDKFIISNSYDETKSNDKFNIVIEIDEISKIENDVPFGYDRKTSILEKENLENGKKGKGIDVNKDVELVKFENIYGEINTILSRDSIEDITFERKLLFFNNNYRVIITVYGNVYKIINAMPSYFNYNKSSKIFSWVYKKNGSNFQEFIDTIKKSNNNYATLWFNSIRDILNEIKINNLNSIKLYYKTLLNNLRFRETAGSNGKFIRTLLKNEKLEFIEKGNEETINGVKGNWVKVKTEKGEIGWCFDGYLEEIK